MEEDERIRSALSRLTANEKECLRRRLLPQTAKEMAIDLGISPHAVEKRLKMARAKLGLASSLEAARLLVTAEGYDRSGPQPSDLAPDTEAGDDPAAAGMSSQDTVPITRRIGPAFLWGAILMITFAIGLLALAAQNPEPAMSPAHVTQPDTPLGRAINLNDQKMRPATREEILKAVSDAFDLMDANHSGFIERDEAPAQGIGLGEPQPIGTTPKMGGKMTWITGKMGQAMWISNIDTDGDGKVSKTEFIAWDSPYFLSRGTLPVNPAATH